MKHKHTAVWLVLTIVAALAFGTHSSAQANMLANPGFEDGGGSYNGWDTFGSGPQLSLPGGDNISRSGVAAAKIFGEFNNCPETPGFDVGGVFQSFTPTPGMECEFSGYSYVSSADTIPGTDTCLSNRLLAKIVFFDAAVGGNEIASNEIVIGDWTTPVDQWIPFSVKAPVPSAALRVQAMFLFLQPGCDEGAVFVDDTSFVEYSPTTEPNVLVNPSFDTDLTGWSTFGNVWYDGRSWARRTPTGGVKMYGTFVEGNDSGMFQIFPATEGSIWKLDAHAMTTCVESPIQPGNQNYILARIVFKDGLGAEIGFNESVIMDSTAFLGAWAKHTLMAEAPAGTDSVAAYFLFIQPALEGGAAWLDDISLYDIADVGVPPVTGSAGVKLHQNAPNPFNPSTRIQFETAARERVELVVYNVAGQRVTTLLSQELDPGPHSVTWDGRTADGRRAASGTYWYVLRTPRGEASRSMVLLK